MQPHISLEDRLERLEKLLGIHNVTRRLFEADGEESDKQDEYTSASKDYIDKAVNDPEVQKKVDAISKSLKNAGLVEYVANVNDMMSDDKGRLALELVAGTLPDDKLKKLGLKNVTFKFVSNKAVPVSNLCPTQNEISLQDSLEKPVANEFNCMYDLIKGQSVKLSVPIITCNGKFIIDGHHRWLQAACVNPDATMETLDLQIDACVSGVDFTDTEDILKVTQSLIMAIALKSGKTKLPSADSKSLENLYALSAQQLFDDIINLNCSHEGLSVLACTERVSDCKFSDEVESRVINAVNSITDDRLYEVKKNIYAWKDLDDDVKAAIYLTANCLSLPKPYENATLRKYMPQTDGGDDMNISQAELNKAAADGLNVKECKHITTEHKLKIIERRLTNIEHLLRNRNK